jgi:tRNA (cmo5U34)-methyltransferase
MTGFSDPDAVDRYAEGPRRMVPGFADMQRMAAILLAERAGPQGQILVLGAGGGLELQVFADMQPDWTLVGVDPSAQMLALAAQTTAPFADRVQLHEGYIYTAPDGPFDGAACLLTLHFVPRDERVRTLTALRQRLKPGAALVIAHHSFAQDEASKALWLGRFAAFATASGVTTLTPASAIASIGQKLPVISPDDEEAALRTAGFTGITLFYAAFTFRGWVAYNG